MGCQDRSLRHNHRGIRHCKQREMNLQPLMILDIQMLRTRLMTLVEGTDFVSKRGPENKK